VVKRQAIQQAYTQQAYMQQAYTQQAYMQQAKQQEYMQQAGTGLTERWGASMKVIEKPASI
jgi:hypothetical protein